jgi:hypothetical protein
MIRKNETQLRKQEMVKVARAMLTVKHRLQLDRDLNEVIPDLEDAFDDAIANGVLPGEVDIRALVSGVLNDED